MGSWWPWRTRTKDDWCHGDVTTFNVSRNETKVNTWVVCLYTSALPLCRSWVNVFPRAVIERLSRVQFFLMIGKVQCRIVFPKDVMTTVYLRCVDKRLQTSPCTQRRQHLSRQDSTGRYLPCHASSQWDSLSHILISLITQKQAWFVLIMVVFVDVHLGNVRGKGILLIQFQESVSCTDLSFVIIINNILHFSSSLKKNWKELVQWLLRRSLKQTRKQRITNCIKS